MEMGFTWIWQSLLFILTDLKTPPTKSKVISIVCHEQKHFSKVGQVFRIEGKSLEMILEAEVINIQHIFYILNSLSH